MTKSRHLTSALTAIVTALLSQNGLCQGPLAQGNVAFHFHNAFAAAGTEHLGLYNMICPRIEDATTGEIATQRGARSASIDQAVPKKVLDNLYYVGEYAR